MVQVRFFGLLSSVSCPSKHAINYPFPYSQSLPFHFWMRFQISSAKQKHFLHAGEFGKKPA